MSEGDSQTSAGAPHALPSELIHDLRTPLNHIIGYTEMLIEQAQEQGQDDFVPDLQKIHAAGKQMLALINDNFHSIRSPETREAVAAPREEHSAPIEQEPAAEASSQQRRQGILAGRG